MMYDVCRYSRIDPRVRWLAYTLKRWVKARHLNDPSDSTLSSYGLIMVRARTHSSISYANTHTLPDTWRPRSSRINQSCSALQP